MVNRANRQWLKAVRKNHLLAVAKPAGAGPTPRPLWGYPDNLPLTGSDGPEGLERRVHSSKVPQSYIIVISTSDHPRPRGVHGQCWDRCMDIIGIHLPALLSFSVTSSLFLLPLIIPSLLHLLSLPFPLLHSFPTFCSSPYLHYCILPQSCMYFRRSSILGTVLTDKADKLVKIKLWRANQLGNRWEIGDINQRGERRERREDKRNGTVANARNIHKR